MHGFMGRFMSGTGEQGARHWMRAMCGVGLGLLLAGCGYTLVDESAVFGPEVRDIVIRDMENRTTEVGFEVKMVDALQEEFVRRGVVQPRYGSDSTREGLTLSGAVVAAEVQPNAFSSVALTLEDQIEIILSIAVDRLDTGESVLNLPTLTYTERFLASADPQVYESNKEQALRRIAARAASQIHDVLFQQPF